MKSESDLTSKFYPTLRLAIENYRSNITSILKKHYLEIENKQHQIEVLKNNINQNCAKIKELQNQLRFYEARVLKYEAMLLSV